MQPGYMRALLPDSAPAEPENWDEIFKDIEKIIMPGVGALWECFLDLLLLIILNTCFKQGVISASIIITADYFSCSRTFGCLLVCVFFKFRKQIFQRQRYRLKVSAT